MQHAGLQYGQAAANSHQSPPFAHADISSVQQNAGGTTTSSLRQFRKKDGTEKNGNSELNSSIETHIARVPPHNHFPARPNEYYRYQHQYPDYSSPYKETPAQVKYSEIAETPSQPIQHVDHIPAALQKHKEVHKDYMEMCNISQQPHMKQNYPDNLTRQQSYPPDAASVHHQYLHKEPQVHPSYKPESQYQQYPQLSKYNMPSQCRKYPPPPPPPENDFLAKLQRINPTMARSIMSDHHIRESQTTYPTMDQSRMYPQNRQYYPPTHLQNNPYNYQPYNYPSSCNYKHPEYPRANQMTVGGTQYPALNPHSDRSISPRNLHMMNYGTSPQKISPNYSQYNPPEFAQHYQHRRASIPQEYYQQTCRTNPYIGGHQISPEPSDNRGGASAGLRHFIENWAEEEVTAEVTPIFKENIRIHNNDSTNEQVFVISPSDIPQLENVSLVPTENGQYILKSGTLDNSVVTIQKTNENNDERTVNLQIVEAAPKSDCMLAEENEKVDEEVSTVPYQENQNAKDCDDSTKITTTQDDKNEETLPKKEGCEEKPEESTEEANVNINDEVSLIKDMPLIDEDHPREVVDKVEKQSSDGHVSSENNEDEKTNNGEETPEEEDQSPPNKRSQRIFSVDDIINNIGSSPIQSRKNSLQLSSKEDEEAEEVEKVEEEEKDDLKIKETSNTTTTEKEDTEIGNETEYRNAISVEDDSVILEIGGAWVQLNISHSNGTKVLSVLPLSESLVIDVNGNYKTTEEENEKIQDNLETSETVPDNLQDEEILPEVEPVEEKTSHQNSNEDNLQKDEVVVENVNDDKEVAHNVEDKIPTVFEESKEEQVVSQIEENKKEDAVSSVTENFQNEDTVDATIQNSDAIDISANEIIIGDEESEDNEVVLDLDVDTTLDEPSPPPSPVTTPIPTPVITTPVTTPTEEGKKPKSFEMIKKRDDRKRSREGNDRKKSSSKKSKEERRDNDDRHRIKKKEESKRGRNDSQKLTTEVKKDRKEKDLSPSKKIDKREKEENLKKKDVQEVVVKTKKSDKKLASQSSVDEDNGKRKEDLVIKLKKSEKKESSLDEYNVKRNEEHEEKSDSVDLVLKLKKIEKKPTTSQSIVEDNVTKKENVEKHEKVVGKVENCLQESEENDDIVKKVEEAIEEECNRKETDFKLKRKLTASPNSEEKNVSIENKIEETLNFEENSFKQKELPQSSTDSLHKPREMETVCNEENKDVEKPVTKAAKKLYVTDTSEGRKSTKSEASQSTKTETKKPSSRLEETVNKIKSLKEKNINKEDNKLKKPSIKEPLREEKKTTKIVKKVTFSLETEIREISKDEIDKKKLSWQEYSSRKRKSSVSSETEETKNQKIMENTVTSTDDINDEVVEKVALDIENAIKDSNLQKTSPKMAPSNWEDDTLSPESPTKDEVMSTTNRKCIIDVNEFNIKPIESVSTPSPVSSSQFSYHSEDDSLQVYKDVVDSKLNSLNIKIPKISKPKAVERFSVIFDRFLNKGSLNCDELEEVKKFIEIKRKMLEEEKKLTYEVRNERDYKDLKLHFRKVPEKRKKKRFRNLYAEDTSEDSDSSRSEKGVGDYSVYQRDSQGVPKLIFKRKSGLPQPFVKLERSQAVELLAKKRKLY